MRLFLVQHGESTSEEADPERPLTDRGVEDVRRVAFHVSRTGIVAVDRILHSGKTRARQTAEIWVEVLRVPIEEAGGLGPLDDPTAWATRLAEEDRDVMLVGHLPHLAKLAALLIAGDAERPVIRFQQGGVVGLEGGPDGWLAWLVLPPEAV